MEQGQGVTKNYNEHVKLEEIEQYKNGTKLSNI